MEKNKQSFLDRFLPTKPKPVAPKETPFSAGDRIKQIQKVQKTRKQIMDELDKS